MIVALLATYATTLILTEADGPYGVFAQLRNRLAALRCFLCTSVWVGAAVALFTPSPLNWLLTALALSGGAILFDRLTMGRM